MLKCNTLLAARGMKTPFYLGNAGLSSAELVVSVPLSLTIAFGIPLLPGGLPQDDFNVTL